MRLRFKVYYIYINRFYGERVATVWSRYSDTNLMLLLYPRDHMSIFYMEL